MPEPLAPASLLGLAAFGFRRWLGDSDRLAAFADLESGEAPHRDVFLQRADLRADQLSDRNRLVFDEGLVKQANFLVELGHLAFHNLFDHRRGLACCRSLRTID